MSLEQCRLISSQSINDARGDIGVVECGRQVPFDIKRIYYLYNIPQDAERGAHGHRKLQQVIIPLVGSFDIQLDDGQNTRKFHLNNPAQGLYVSAGLWRVLSNFSAGAVCLVLASELYDESDYYRFYDDFINARPLRKAD
jgi:hypothetical protein